MPRLEGLPPSRIWEAEVPEFRARIWATILPAAASLNSALRCSRSVNATGEELWTRLRKCACDIYGRCPTREIYRPFVSELMKELLTDAPVVEGLAHWPPEVAKVYASPECVLKEMPADDESMFDELQRKYSHLGGEQGEWVAYHHRCDVRSQQYLEQNTFRYL